MQNLKYFAVDVTSILEWNRAPVGIIRTQLEFVKYLYLNDRDSVYFRFNDNKDELIAVEKSIIEQKIEQLLNIKEHGGAHKIKYTEPQNRFSSNIKKALDILKEDGLIILLIKIIKKVCPPKLKSLLRIVYTRLFNTKPDTVVQKAIERSMFRAEIYRAHYLKIPSFLKQNAVVVSMGLDWDYSNYGLLYWLKKRIGFEFIGSFYDAIPISNPELVLSYSFSQRFFSHLYYLIHLSDKIFCISNFSKKQLSDICEAHHIHRIPELKTIYLGNDIKRNPQHNNTKKQGDTKEYVLYVSTIEARKNHILLLRVWQKLQRESFIDLPDLVLVGMLGWGISEFMELYKNDENLQKIVHLRHDVDDNELISIYNNARFTVFPSIIEGWGLGATESMLYEKPCITSNCDALIEATQGLMPRVRYDDVDGWCDAIRRLSSDNDLLESYRQTIKERFKSRTWEEFSIDFAKFAKGKI